MPSHITLHLFQMVIIKFRFTKIIGSRYVAKAGISNGGSFKTVKI